MTSLDLVTQSHEDDLYQRAFEIEYLDGEPVAVIVHAPADLVPAVRIPVSDALTSRDVAWALAAQLNELHRIREATRRRIDRRAQ